MPARERYEIDAEVAARSERDRRLTDRVAQYLADQNNDPMCRFYSDQAEEIMAMVRDSDRAQLFLQAAE